MAEYLNNELTFFVDDSKYQTMATFSEQKNA